MEKVQESNMQIWFNKRAGCNILADCKQVKNEFKWNFEKSKTKNAFLVFFAENWAYVGQPDDHIGWAKWMPFVSIDPTHPRTTLWNFGENCSAFDGGWKTQYFWVGHFDFFFFKTLYVINVTVVP